jgi:hypothetical protein
LQCRKEHSEKLNDLYSLSDFIRMIKSKRMGWAGHVARVVEKRNPYHRLVGKPEGRRGLDRSMALKCKGKDKARPKTGHRGLEVE